jgi:uncharacterized membrane protein
MSVMDRLRSSDTQGSDDPLGRALGLASVGLGLPMLLRPGTVDRAAGVGDGAKQRTITAAVGAREFVHAAGLLHPRLGSRWAVTRVLGDAMDLTVLGVALRRHDRKGLGRTVAATAAIAAITAVDIYAAIRSWTAAGKEQSMDLTATTTVGKSPQEVYEFWRRFEQLPEFMAHVDDVRQESDTRSHWRVTAPFGRTVEWDAEITQDVPGQVIAWRSTGDADVSNSGRVRFSPAPRGQGTELHVALTYEVPGGALAEALARWAGEDPHQQLDDDLRRFKQVMETGQVVRSEGAPWGKKARKEFPQHPAQPLSDDEMAELVHEEVRA